MSKTLKVVGDNIILKATKRNNGIIVIEKNNPANRRKWLIENTVIYDFGTKIKGYKEGQTVVIDPNTPIKQVPVDKLLDRETKPKAEDEEQIVYFAIKEEHIIAVIN